MSVAEAASSGDRKDALVALRDRLAEEVDREIVQGYCVECKRGSSSIAPIAKQLRDVLDQLDALPSSHEESELDDIAARRAARRAERRAAAATS